MRATDRARGTPKPHATRRTRATMEAGTRDRCRQAPYSTPAPGARSRRRVVTPCDLGPSASVARPKTPATLTATRNVYAPVLQELRGAMRGPETNIFCRTAELKAAVNERVPSEHALRTSGGAPNPATVAAEQAFVSAVEEVFGVHHDLLKSPEKHEPPAALCVPAGGAHTPSLNLHFPMHHHAPRVGCARARPSAALHTSGGCLSRVFRRNPLTLTLTRWTTCVFAATYIYKARSRLLMHNEA